MTEEQPDYLDDDGDDGDDEFLTTAEDIQSANDEELADISDSLNSTDSDDDDGDESESWYDTPTVSEYAESELEDDEIPVIPPITDEQLRQDMRTRMANRKDASRIIDHPNELIGERLSRSRWAAHHEQIRQQDLSDLDPSTVAEREAAAINRVAEYMELEEQDDGMGIVGPGSDHSDEEAVQRNRNAQGNWQAFCDDPDS